jgi:transposase
MQAITTIGLDIAKSVFQLHGIDAAGSVVIRRQLKRRYVLAFLEKLPSCLIGIEACPTSHHWSRELQALGHTVRLIPPAYVRPYAPPRDRSRINRSTHPSTARIEGDSGVRQENTAVASLE